MSYFNEIPSIDSKFDKINKFYKEFLKLKKVKSRDAPLLYDELVNMYKK